MKKLLLLSTLLACLFSTNILQACDEGIANLNSVTDNMDGTFTYELYVCTEHLGLEGNPYDFSFSFSPASVAVQPGFTPTSVFTSSGDEYVGVIQATNYLQYSTSEVYPAHNQSILCNTYTITTVGAASQILVDINENRGESSCNRVIIICNIAATAEADFNVCVSDTDPVPVQLNSGYTGTPTGTVNYTWTSNPNVSSLMNSTTIEDPIFTIPAAATPGPVTFTVEMDDNGCVVTDQFVVNVLASNDPSCTPPPCVPDITPAGPFCEFDAATNLNAAQGGGTWSGTGITNQVNGTFNPGSAGPGTWEIIYSLPCGENDTTYITVDQQADAGFGYPSSTYSTCDANPTAIVTGDPGGAFSINNGGVINSGDGTVDLAASGAGTYTITYTVSSTCPNASNANVLITITDNPPTITCPSDVVTVSEPGVCTALVTYIVTGTDDCPGIPTIAQLNGLPSGSDFPEGITTNTFLATDAGGHTAACSFNVTVNDTQDPSITCPSDITQGTDLGSCSATVSVPLPTTADNCSVANILNNYNFSSDASDTYPLGNTTVGWSVADIAGNLSVCNMTISVIDDVNPTLVCPADMSVNVEPGFCVGLAMVPLPTVSDNCSLNGYINDYTFGPDASSYYPAGATNVTYTATDNAGNESFCTFVVTVVDNEAPTISCPSDVTVFGNPCSANLTIPQPSASDNCSGFSYINDFNGTNNGSDTYPTGIHLVTWTVTDGGGNTANCVQTISIIDKDNPFITCAADVIVNANPGESNAFVSVPQPTYGDDCSINMVWNDVTGTSSADAIYPVGLTTVTWAVTDDYGNSAACTQEVTVNGTGCISDSYEPNDSFGAASGFPTQGINLDANICSGDQDFYMFNTGSYTYFRAELLCLAADFKLDVYTSAQVLIASSDEPGQSNESIRLDNLMPGTDYYLMVEGSGGAYQDYIGYCLHLTQGMSEIWNEEPAWEVAEASTLYPNPAETELYYSFHSSKEANIQYQITDVLGRLVSVSTQKAGVGQNKHRLDISPLAAGTYQLRVQGSGSPSVKKFVVVNK